MSSFAASGAAAGSIIPGLGTAVGGGLGAAADAISGLIGSHGPSAVDIASAMNSAESIGATRGTDGWWYDKRDNHKLSHEEARARQTQAAAAIGAVVGAGDYWFDTRDNHKLGHLEASTKLAAIGGWDGVVAGRTYQAVQGASTVNTGVPELATVGAFESTTSQPPLVSALPTHFPVPGAPGPVKDGTSVPTALTKNRVAEGAQGGFLSQTVAGVPVWVAGIATILVIAVLFRIGRK